MAFVIFKPCTIPYIFHVPYHTSFMYFPVRTIPYHTYLLPSLAYIWFTLNTHTHTQIVVDSSSVVDWLFYHVMCQVARSVKLNWMGLFILWFIVGLSMRSESRTCFNIMTWHNLGWSLQILVSFFSKYRVVWCSAILLKRFWETIKTIFLKQI